MKQFSTRRTTFPDPRNAPADGILDINDDVRVERLLEAYSFGIFPWPHQDLPTIWCSPDPRGVLDFIDFHISRSLQKFIAKSDFDWTWNQAFDGVLEACAKVARPQQTGTWITPRLTRAYRAFHAAGYAHSLEVWSRDELVGGLYGVYVGGLFCGESMFYLKPNASKFAVVKAVEFLRANGLLWMDIQMVTPVLASFGGKYLQREIYLDRLELSKQQSRPLAFKRT